MGGGAAARGRSPGKKMSRKSPGSPGDSSSAGSRTSESHREEVAREARATGVLVSGGSLSEYEVLKAIGKGKFSVVYRAKRRVDQRLVAVKKVAIVDIMDKRHGTSVSRR